MKGSPAFFFLCGSPGSAMKKRDIPHRLPAEIGLLATLQPFRLLDRQGDFFRLFQELLEPPLFKELFDNIPCVTPGSGQEGKRYLHLTGTSLARAMEYCPLPGLRVKASTGHHAPTWFVISARSAGV